MKETKDKKLELLVVEDRLENIEAAKQYFSTKEDLEVDFASNYKEASQKLQKKIYAGAILDIEFPRTEYDKTEKLGLELGKELIGRYRLPYVFLTGGYIHHGPRAKIFIDEFCVEKDKGDMVENKTSSGAWKRAYETLVEICPNMKEIAEAKLRYLRYKK